MRTETVNNETRRTRVEREDIVSDLTSSAPFVVSDGSGQVAVAPEGASVDHPERVVDRFDPQTASVPANLAGVVGTLLRSGGESGTLGFRYQEWIIRPGARLYVHGEVADATGRLAFAKPAQGRYIISTRSEEQIVGAAQRNAGIALAAAAVAAIAGVVLIVLGAVG
jgi:hypothetical protein